MANEYVTETDLADYLKVTIPSGGARVQIEHTNGQIVDLIGVLTDVPWGVKSIALEVAARGYRNPEALTSTTKTIDDFTITKRREGVNAEKAGIYLTKAERRRLLKLAGKTTASTYGTVRLRVP